MPRKTPHPRRHTWPLVINATIFARDRQEAIELDRYGTSYSLWCWQQEERSKYTPDLMLHPRNGPNGEITRLL